MVPANEKLTWSCDEWVSSINKRKVELSSYKPNKH